MARPDPFTWATDAAADVSEPSASRKLLGYVAGLIPPAGQHNWLFQKLGQWVTFLSTSPVVYATQEAAAADTSSGDVCIVDEKTDNSAGNLETGYASNGKAAGTNILDIAVSATHVYYLEAGVTVHRGALRSAPGTPTLTLTQTNAGTAIRIVTDGDRVLICAGNYVEMFNATTGVSVWAYNHGATVNDACFGAGGVVFMCGALGTGNMHARTLSRTLGTAIASYRHSNAAGTLEACAYANDLYYIAGAASDYASLADVRALTTGLLAETAEGPGSADTTGRAWNRNFGTSIVRNGAMTTDGRLLWLGYPTGATYQVMAYNLVTGATVAEIDLGTHTTQSLDADHRWIVVGTIDTGDTDRGHVYGIDPQTMQVAWHYRYAVATTILNGVVTDGSRAWACLSIAVAENGILKIVTGRDTSTFRRMDYAAGLDSAFSNPSGLRGLLVAVE